MNHLLKEDDPRKQEIHPDKVELQPECSKNENPTKKPRGRPRKSELDGHLTSIIAKVKAQREARMKRVSEDE